jgi:hypothetical protein
MLRLGATQADVYARARDGSRRRGLVVVAALARRGWQDARVRGGAERHRAPAARRGGRRVADDGATSGLAQCCRLPYARANGRDAAAAADNAEAAGRSGAVVAAVEAGGVPAC